MLSRIDCYVPSRNSMAEVVVPSRESIRQQKLQMDDGYITADCIFETGGETKMSRLFAKWDKELMDEME